jgi:cold shock CspA family protein
MTYFETRKGKPMTDGARQTGVVLRAYPDKGFGFARPDGETTPSQDVFLFWKALKDAGVECDEQLQGRRLSWVADMTPRGLRAVDIRPL